MITKRKGFLLRCISESPVNWWLENGKKVMAPSSNYRIKESMIVLSGWTWDSGFCICFCNCSWWTFSQTPLPQCRGAAGSVICGEFVVNYCHANSFYPGLFVRLLVRQQCASVKVFCSPKVSSSHSWHQFSACLVFICGAAQRLG